MMASAAVRKKHALIGIAAACSVAHDLNEARIVCSEELRVSRRSSYLALLQDQSLILFLQ